MKFIKTLFALMLIFGLSLKSFSQEKIENEVEMEAYKAAYNAYIWAYPLITTGLNAVSHPNFAQFNLEAKQAQFLTPFWNGDNLISSTFVDLKQGGIQISVPEIGKKTFSLLIKDGYLNTIDFIGTANVGNKAGNYLIVGPDWTGSIPENIQKTIHASTNLVWLCNRLSIENDDEITIKLQNAFRITTINDAKLKSWAERLQLPTLKNPSASVPDQIRAMDWKSYYLWMNKLIRENPASDKQKDYVAEFKDFNMTFNVDFEPNKLRNKQKRGVQQAYLDAIEFMKTQSQSTLKNDSTNNGWTYKNAVLDWDRNYALRAKYAAKTGINNQILNDALYLTCSTDKTENELNASNTNYILTFKKGQLPPSATFWTITLYNEQDILFENPLKKYTIRDKNKGLRLNKDGSLSLYFQKDAPKGKEANWLPAPNGKFKLQMRIYSPGKNIYNGKWMPPAVEKITAKAKS